MYCYLLQLYPWSLSLKSSFELSHNWNKQIELPIHHFFLLTLVKIQFWSQNTITTTMSVIDLLTRVDSICKKYDKYDLDKNKDANVTGDDAFVRLYASVDSDIENLLQVASSKTHKIVP